MKKQKNESQCAYGRRTMKITGNTPDGLKVSIKGTCKLTLINDY